MEYSGPDTIVDIEADLALSSDESEVEMQNWPSLPLPPQKRRGSPTPLSASLSTPHTHHPTAQPSSSTKRPMSHTSDSDSKSSSPTAKSFKRQDTASPQPGTSTNGFVTRQSVQPSQQTSHTILTPPAFAPRTDYVKLLFKDNPSAEVKLRWLTEVTRAYQLDKTRAEVKMAAITSRFVYISRLRTDIVDSVTKGKFLSIFLEIQDSPERPRKYPTYLLTRYPVYLDHSLAKELQGIHTTRRFHQNGEPINRLVVTWSLPDPPPESVNFSFLPCLPACEFRRMNDEQPWCYRCWGIGHISRYCSASEKCAWCSGEHDSRTCPHRNPPPVAVNSASTSSQPVLPTTDTSQWKCPRCHQEGVSVWHGCARRRQIATAVPPRAPQPLHTASPPAPTNPESTQVTALRDAITSLKSKFNTLTARFDAIESRLDELANKNDNVEATLNSLVEAQKVVIATVSSLTEKLDSVTTRLMELSTLSLKSPTRGSSQSATTTTTTTSTTASSRKRNGRLQ